MGEAERGVKLVTLVNELNFSKQHLMGPWNCKSNNYFMQKCSHTISSKELFMQRMKARRRYWEWGREPTSSNLLRTLRTSPTLNLGAHCPPQSTLICWWRMTSDHLSFTGLHLNLNGGWNWGPSWPFWHSTIPHMRWGESRRRRIWETFKNYLLLY